MRRSFAIAGLVLLAFLAGICFTIFGGGEPARPERSVRSNLSPRPANDAGPAEPIPPATGPMTELPHPGNAIAARVPPTDPAGVEVRKLLREAVTLRKQRDWSRLRVLQDKIAALSRRDINILMHLLKTDAEVESALMIGDILARQADDPERAAWIRPAAPALARTFRRLVEREDAGASADDRARALEHLARFAGAEDVDFLLALLRDPERGALRQAAGLALAKVGDPALCLDPVRASATRPTDLRAQAYLVIAADGLARRAGGDSAREWARTRLVPDLQKGIALSTDAIARAEALAALAMVSGQPLTETLLAAVESNPDPDARRSLIALLPDVAGDEEIDMLRARLGKDEAIHEALEAALAKVAERAGGK